LSKLSNKYLAGFLDADGCIHVQWKSGVYKPLLNVSFCQSTLQDEIIHRIHLENGGRIRVKSIKDAEYTELILAGATAENLLNRIKNDLVIKRHYAHAVISIIEKRKPPADLESTKKWLKEQRRVKSLPLPNFPPRKWLAGYFDGDGSLWTIYRKSGKHVQVSTGIACSGYDMEGIEIIQKGFGGIIKPHNQGNDVYQWILSLSPSKTIKFIEYFGKHLIVKRDQADYLLACARMGNFRDGKTIHTHLKYLKAHPHRLSEPGVNIQALVANVKRIPSKVWRKNI